MTIKPKHATGAVHFRKLLVMPTCRELKRTEDCYLEASKQCSDYVRENVEAAWQVTKGLVEGQCADDDKARCSAIQARSCWRQLRRLEDETTDFQDVCK